VVKEKTDEVDAEKAQYMKAAEKRCCRQCGSAVVKSTTQYFATMRAKSKIEKTSRGLAEDVESRMLCGSQSRRCVRD
jgi:hypothetical protein